MKKIVLWGLCAVSLFMAFTLFVTVPSSFEDEVKCINAHYPADFYMVDLIKDSKAENELEREYIFNNTRYDIEIDKDEIDSVFYVCGVDDPSIAFSEKDITYAMSDEYGKTYKTICTIGGVLFGVVGMVFLLLAVRKKKIQPQFNNYNNSGLNGLGNISTPSSNYYNNPMANGSITVPQQPMNNQGYPQQGYDQNGYGYNQNGYNQNGYGQNGYNQNNYNQNNYNGGNNSY